jgi:sigma-B regulation protein RsbU (phosphoserine phosphatase)
MATPVTDMRAQLLDRRQRLAAIVETGTITPQLEGLLRDVDDALERVAAGRYGLCDTCGDPIEEDRLEADPLIRLCLDHLTLTEARALEEDLDLAGRVQRTLLPPSPLVDQGWEMAYHYQPLGAVSGDYCDAVRATGSDEGLVLLLGDISGKGVAASILMAHLHASMRTLVGFNLPLTQLIQRANRLFCDSTMANHYATLVCARFGASGQVEICNAGHCPPLFLHKGNIVPVEATGVPIGMFCVKDYAVKVHTLEPGDALVLYTDGITEARNPADEEYGEQRLALLVARLGGETPQAIVNACVADVAGFRDRARQFDDLTVMVVRRSR